MFINLIIVVLAFIFGYYVKYLLYKRERESNETEFQMEMMNPLDNPNLPPPDITTTIYLDGMKITNAHISESISFFIEEGDIFKTSYFTEWLIRLTDMQRQKVDITYGNTGSLKGCFPIAIVNNPNASTEVIMSYDYIYYDNTYLPFQKSYWF